MNIQILLGRTLAIALTGVVIFAAAFPAMAETGYLPDVREEMTDPAFWIGENEGTDEVLADLPQLQELNQLFIEAEDCHMNNMTEIPHYIERDPFYRWLWGEAYTAAAGLIQSPHFFEDEDGITGAAIDRILENIGEAGEEKYSRVYYGICVRTTDMCAFPTAEILTDEQGDSNYNDNQLTALHVGEPVVIKTFSEDGMYCWCDSETVSGWVDSDDVAICADKNEWLEAWQIPDEEAVVVTAGKLYLEASNVSPDTSEVLLTMGTVLRRISPEEYEASSLGRALYHNTPVWLPVREADGSYAVTPALIAEHQGISEGYLPLTTRNLLRIAFSRLGDVYGWGSMLHSVDCSDYVRNIYRCFGLNLPRNTSWQAAAPAFKYDVSEAADEEKMAVLDTLPAGSVLIFAGHEMMYLGSEDGKYYVISSVSTMKDFDTEERLRVRSVVINTLDVSRMNGLTWLSSLHTMLVPWELPESGTGTLTEE